MSPADIPPGPLLVDTDVATWLLLNADQANPWRPLLRGHLLALSFANVGELLALPISRGWGAPRATAFRAAIESAFVVVPFTIAVAEQWASLHVRYRGHLQKGGANDLWVAATALSSTPRLPIATNNRSDFSKVAADQPLQIIHPSTHAATAQTD